MKRIIFASTLILGLAAAAAAQENPEVGAPNPERIGVEAAQQQLKEISVDRFERDGYWSSSISTDDGYSLTRIFEGNPSSLKQPIPDEEGMDIPDRYILGTRVNFLKRGKNAFTIFPSHPIPIEGITKTVSVLVAGRNFNHILKLIVEDYKGKRFELHMGKLNFSGWKQMTVAIPPSPNSSLGIVQRDYHYNHKMGIKIVGFKVECDPVDAYGTYYIYMDDLRAVTDLFAEESRDGDDPEDLW